MECLKRIEEALVAPEEIAVNNGGLLSSWNLDVESFLVASGPSGAFDEKEDSDDAEEEIHRIGSIALMLNRGIVSAVDEVVEIGDGAPNHRDDNNCDLETRSALDRFALSKKCHDIRQVDVYVRASKNMLRWYLQFYLDFRKDQYREGHGYLPSCPICVLQSDATLELMVALLKELKEEGEELVRNILLFLFYATYIPFHGDETSQHALSYLINKLAYPELALELLTRPCSAAVALAIVRNIHNAIVSLQGAAKYIMNTRYQFELPVSDGTAPWAPTESISVDFRSILIDTVRWAVEESTPSFPGNNNPNGVETEDKRAELVTEILRMFYALRIGQGLMPSKCESGIMQLVATLLVLDDDKKETKIMEVKLATISILMDSHPSFAGYLIEKEAVQPLLSILDYQVTDILEGTKIDNSAVSSLVPILVVLNKYSKADSAFRSRVKDYIFPSDAEGDFQNKVKEQQGHEASSKRRNMGPLNAPKGSLRWKLISLLTWTESHIKRCTGELFWTLSYEDASEFVHRVGFGNALPILSSRGLAEIPTQTL